MYTVYIDITCTVEWLNVCSSVIVFGGWITTLSQFNPNNLIYNFCDISCHGVGIA